MCVFGYRIDIGSRPAAFVFKPVERVVCEMAFKTACVAEQMKVCTQG